MITFQWARELRRSGYRSSIAVVFVIPDGENVKVGRYNDEGKSVSAAEAVAAFMSARLTQSNSALREARAQEAQKVAEISSLQRLVAQSGQSAQAAQKLDDEWRKLVASDAIVQRLAAAGLQPEELLQKPDDIRVVETLIRQGLSGNEIAASVKEAAELRSQLVGKSVAFTSKAELVELAELGQEAKRRDGGEHDWPPIVNLSEAKGYSFGTGRAELTSDFKTQIETSIAEQVVGIIKKYKASVVEVIGHIDEQPVSPRPSISTRASSRFCPAKPR
ncbi:hypothetical protein [Methylopila sp. Yamaguchi]|uniref:hypothetical protein n=1 Tax=Methylopila sp. Yamaguchi TaxID=1437817 RepID=UPI000CC9BD3D|nr:hypothetical protein [Methylopila sp. Yamaguchi]GBD49828.1 hypothetical protein METY_3041 [Methylopila sp. Yamaguchi]